MFICLSVFLHCGTFNLLPFATVLVHFTCFFEFFTPAVVLFICTWVFMVSLLILWPFLYFNRRVFTCNEVVLVINTLLLPFSFFFKDELKPNFNFFYTYENYWMDIFIYLFWWTFQSPAISAIPVGTYLGSYLEVLYKFIFIASGKEKHRNKIQI